MIKAIYHDGIIEPVDPVPHEWKDGQELQVQQPSTSDISAELQAQFDSLSVQWKEETRYLSSTTDIATNAAYQRIIGLGMPVVPLILNDLRSEPYHWFWALNAITGEQPVAEEARGQIGEMADAWISWGIAKKLINADEPGE